MTGLKRPALLRAMRAAALLIAAMFVAPALAEPAHVLVTLPVGAKMPADLAGTLSAWRQSGQVSDVLWLETTQRENAGFATLVALEFPTQGSYEAWVKEGQ